MFPAPDRSAKVWSVFVVLVALLHSVHQDVQIVFVPLRVLVLMEKLMVLQPGIAIFSTTSVGLFQTQTFSISFFPLCHSAPIHNTWSAV